MAHRCRTINSSPSDLTGFKAKLDTWTEEHEEQFIGLPVIYHVLYRVPYENIKSEVIEAQHKSLNADFSMRNADIDRLNDRGPYAFALFKGNPRITFGPFSETLVRRMALNPQQPPFRSLRDTLAFGGSPPVVGAINIYIAPLENVLGEALRESFVCVCDTRVIGSREKPSGIANYGYGRTLTHQISHCLSLQHPFGWPKTGPWPHSDIPKQMHPNYIARFVRLQDGTWSCAKDNKDLDDKQLNVVDPITDQRIPGPYSFGESHEMFVNFMDLAVDDSAVMFTKDQARQMRLYVLNSGKFNYTLTESETDESTADPIRVQTVVDLSRHQRPGELAREPAHQPRSTSRNYMRAVRAALHSIAPGGSWNTASLITVALVIIVLLSIVSVLRRGRKTPRKQESGAK